jgi:hypothetical protein
MHPRLFSVAALIAALSVGGCASQRIDTMAPRFAQTLGDFHREEVLKNLSRMIDDPTYMPQRTTLSDGKLVFTDTSQLNISGVSIANAQGTGTLGVTVGGLVDSYEVKMTPHQDPNVLEALRKLYLTALYRDHVVYWTSGPNPNPPPCAAISLGTHGRHELWTCDAHRFTALVLATLRAGVPKTAVKPPSSTKRPTSEPSSTPALIIPQGGGTGIVVPR